MNIGTERIQCAPQVQGVRRGRLTAVLALLLLTSTTAGWAQSQGAVTDQPPPSTEQTEPEKKEIPPTTAESDVEKDNSPFDYESSEEISEDLSVSFPVDI